MAVKYTQYDTDEAGTFGLVVDAGLFAMAAALSTSPFKDAGYDSLAALTTAHGAYTAVVPATITPRSVLMDSALGQVNVPCATAAKLASVVADSDGAGQSASLTLIGNSARGEVNRDIA